MNSKIRCVFITWKLDEKENGDAYFHKQMDRHEIKITKSSPPENLLKKYFESLPSCLRTVILDTYGVESKRNIPNSDIGYVLNDDLRLSYFLCYLFFELQEQKKGEAFTKLRDNCSKIQNSKDVGEIKEIILHQYASLHKDSKVNQENIVEKMMVLCKKNYDLLSKKVISDQFYMYYDKELSFFAVEDDNRELNISTIKDRIKFISKEIENIDTENKNAPIVFFLHKSTHKALFAKKDRVVEESVVAIAFSHTGYYKAYRFLCNSIELDGFKKHIVDVAFNIEGLFDAIEQENYALIKSIYDDNLRTHLKIDEAITEKLNMNLSLTTTEYIELISSK